MMSTTIAIVTLLSRSTALLPIAIFGLILTIVGFGLYNVYLHPLRKYPGPKLWAAYRLSYVRSNISGRLPFDVLEMHRKYGPVIRIAPDELAFVDPEARQDIYGLQKGRGQNKRDPQAYGPWMPGAENGILHGDDATHARLRRIYGPAFTPKAVDEQAPLLVKYGNLLVRELKKAIEKDAVQDMSAWYNCATFDLTGELAFDESFHSLEEGGKYHFFIKTVLEGSTTALKAQQLERYGLLTLLKPFMPKSAMKPKDDMDAYVGELVDRRSEKGYVPGKTDVFNFILSSQSAGDKLSRAEFLENGLNLVVAGSETTATLMAGCTYFLCRNRAGLQKVQHEVRSRFANDEEITPKAVNDLEYMIAVLSESFRVFPPAGFPFPRIITSAGGQFIAGQFVPKGMKVSICHHAMYRYDGHFARPEEFHPERWLPNPPSEFRHDRREAMQPFMVGPRGCIGKTLAHAEIRLLLAKMLWHFDFELADPTHDWYGSLKAFMIWERTRLPIKLTPVRR